MLSSTSSGIIPSPTLEPRNQTHTYDVEECVPLLSHSDSEDLHSFSSKDGVAASTWCWQYIQELLGLILYAVDVTLHVLLLKVIISNGHVWQVAAMSVAVAAPHVLVAVLLMVRNGWLSAGWQYCPMVFSLQPLEGLWDASQGLCGLLVASITVIVYVFLCLIGLAFLSYCLLCYLATALVFSLLVLDLLMLAGTLVMCKQFFRPTELIYIENYRVTRLVVEAVLESLPAAIIIILSMVKGVMPILGPPNHVWRADWKGGAWTWLPVASLFVSVVNLVDKGAVLRRGTQLSGTSFWTYLGEVLLVKGAVKVPQPFLSQALSDMILQDGVMRVSDADIMPDEDDNGAAALVPSYLLPVDGGRLVQGQMLNVVRAALQMHGGFHISHGGPCTTPSSPPSPSPQCIKEWLIEYPFGRRHCSVVLAEGLSHLPKLERLTVHNCKLGGAGFQRVGELWQLHGGLREVNLVNVDLSALAGQVLAQVISNNGSMALLEISRSSLPSCAVVAIAHALRINTSILHLNLAADGIDLPGLRALCEMLHVNTRITHVNLAFNPLGSEGGALLAEVVARTSTLRHLALALDGMGAEGARHVVNAVHKVSGFPSSLALTCHDPLHSVVQVQGLPDLSFVCMADYDSLISENWLMELHPHYSTHTMMAHTPLSAHCLTSSQASLSSLANQMSAGTSGSTEVNEKLQPLGLKPTRQVPCKVHLLCYESAIEELAMAPYFISGLRLIDFTSLGLDDNSAQVLADSAMNGVCLEELHLADNKIGDQGAVDLARLLECCSTLRILDLSRNCIGDIGAVALADAAKEHTKLTYLGLQLNESPFSWEALHALQVAAATRAASSGGPLDVDIQDYSPAGAPPIVVVSASRTVSTLAEAPSGQSTSRLSRSSRSGSSSGGEAACGICFDSTDTVAVHPCVHRVCVGCYKELQRLGQPQSRVLCPYCRGPILGYRYLKMPSASPA